MRADRLWFVLGAVVLLAVPIVVVASRSEPGAATLDPSAGLTAPATLPTPVAARLTATPIPTPTLPPLDERCVRGAPGVDSPLAGRTVVLDPGHGGEDLGTVNLEFGLFESELTLSIAELLRDRLVAAGATVCLTRLMDVEVSLQDRARFANEQDADVFVSIHLNRFDDPSVDHTMTMWGEETKDLRLAELLLEALAEELSTPASYGGSLNPLSAATARHEPLESSLVLLPEMPAVLVEAVFLSSTWEARAFVDGQADGTRWREEQIARAIETGLRRYFSEAAERD